MFSTMSIRRFVPIVLASLLLVSPLAPAAETTGPTAAQASGAAPSGAAADAGKAAETAAPAHTTTMGPGMMGGESASDKREGMAMPPRIGGPARPRCPMARGVMKGMMAGGGMGKGGMMAECACHRGMTREQYRELNGRLSVLEARLAKIEVMLERLLEQ